MKRILLFTFITIGIFGCSSSFLKNEEPERLAIEDDAVDVRVKELGEDPNLEGLQDGAIAPGPGGKRLPTPENFKVGDSEKPDKKNKKKKNEKKLNEKNKTLNLVTTVNEAPANITNQAISTNSNGNSSLREPRIENDAGFTGGSRRPDKDPFRVGEKVVMSVRYLKASAGELTLEVRPMVEVNGRKSYRWHTGLRTTGFFSNFYSVEDWAETLVDYESLFPSVYNLSVKETAQLRTGKGFFNHQTLKAVYVEKKFTEKKGNEDKRQEWKVEPFAQNVYSAAFYMRVFTYEVGKEFKFVVSDDENNIVFKGKALRKEHVETEAGEFDTIVIKPEFEIKGVFKPVGDIFFWLTDDDRKLIVRIEAEIKIGTLVMDAIQVDRGR